MASLENIRMPPTGQATVGAYEKELFRKGSIASQSFNPSGVRMQDTAVNPVSISPPRKDLRQPYSAQVNSYSPPYSRTGSRASSYQSPQRNITPDSTHLDQALTNLLLGNDNLAKDDTRIPDAHAQLQYHHHIFDDAPVKKTKMTIRSVSAMSNGREHGTELQIPRSSSAHLGSQISLASDARTMLQTPMSSEGQNSRGVSPQGYARARSASRRSPDSRPMSYIDLLNEIPYAQQIAPGTHANTSALQMAIGNSASLLDANQTLDMYRANVKKTNSPAVQYEFAIYMVNAAKDTLLLEQHQGDRPLTPNTETAADMLKEARNILQRCSDRGYPFAQYYLADGYFSGLFNKDKPDYDKAFPLFVAASKHGHAEASYRAALCHEFGWGTSKNYPKAVQFFRNAASKNHPGAAVRLGKACLTGDMGLGNRYREGVKWLKRAAESADEQYNSGPYELAVLHTTGYGDDVFKDEAYAAQLFTQAADLGHADANYRLGQAYENGTLSCPRDAALSIHFYNGAAIRGIPEAMMALCAWYMVGADPVMARDEAEAYEWAKKAADLDLAKAEYAVGYFTEMGIGCRCDPLEANVWYVRAADKGNDTAAQRLAIIRAAASGDPGIPMARDVAKRKELRGKEKDCIVM